MKLALWIVEPRHAVVEEGEEDDAAGPDVDGGAVVCALDAVVGGENHLRGVSVARADGGEVRDGGVRVVVDGEPKVTELDDGVGLCGVDEDVFHLEVAVDDVVGVDVGQGREELLEDGADGVGGLRGSAGEVEQGAARDKLHDDVHGGGGLEGGVGTDDVAVVGQGGDDSELAGGDCEGGVVAGE